MKKVRLWLAMTMTAMTTSSCIVDIIEIDQSGSKEEQREEEKEKKTEKVETAEENPHDAGQQMPRQQEYSDAAQPAERADAAASQQSAEAGQPPDATAEDCADLSNATLGMVARVNLRDACITETPRPSWSNDAVLATEIVLANGQRFEMLVYRMNPRERFVEFLARAEIGDAFLSPQLIMSEDGKTGYVYETNDHGKDAAPHITVSSPPLVYYFSPHDARETTTDELVRLVNNTELQ